MHPAGTGKARLLSTLLVAQGFVSTGAVAEEPRAESSERTRYNWIMHCQGCHGVEGQGTETGTPALKGEVGRFLRTDEGRAFLGRVPGVAFVSLSNREVADLLNWVVRSFDREHVPKGFKPYTEAEVERLRKQPLISEAPQVRQKILESLQTAE